MPKRNVYNTNRDKISLVNKTTKGEIIYNFLAKHKGKWYKQVEITQKLELPQSTVSNELKKLEGKRFEYGKRKYILIKKEDKYTVTKLDDLSRGLMDNSTLEERKKFENCLSYKEDDFENLNIRTMATAKRVTRTVILYYLNGKSLNTVKNALYELYNNCIFDIVSCDKGLYIIMNEEKSDKNLLAVTNSILELYEQIGIDSKKYNKSGT